MFEDIWKKRCHAVLSYEATYGITNKQKRSKHKIPYRRHTSQPLDQLDEDHNRNDAPSPWLSWYTSSIRKGLKWLDHLFAYQENRLRSLTPELSNNFTTPFLFPNRSSLDSPILTV